MNNHFVKLFFIFLSFQFYAQKLPPINTFSIKDYGAESQNWGISQAENKFIYVANNKGLLEYNGATWQLYTTPNETIMRSVKVFNNIIFTGFYMDFGYWKKNDFNILEFTSIAKQENIQMIEDEQVWNILELDGWIIFQSLERIYLYNLETRLVKIIKAEESIERISKIDEVIYFQEMNKGVFKIENGIKKLISDHKILQQNILVDIFKKEEKLLFLTQEKGFFFLENNELKKWGFSAYKRLNGKTIYSAKQLKNKDYVIGTISDGLFVIDEKGNFKSQITQSSGLSNNTVLSIFEDIENNIWLGLDNGISCVNNASPFKIITSKKGFSGTVYASIIFDKYLYIGTNQGLFYREVNSKKPFRFIENTQGQVWDLVNIDATLFCGHNSGTFIIDKFKAKRIVDIRGTWSIVKKDANTIIQGNYDGLYVLKKENSKWVLRNKISGFNNSSRFFVLADANEIFVNHEYKGVFKLIVDSDYKSVLSVKKDVSVDKGIHSSLIKYNNEVLYASKKGVFKYKNDRKIFERDAVFSKLISKENFTSARLVCNAPNNQLWSFSYEDIKYLSPGKLSDKPVIRSISISESIPKAASGFENIIQIENDSYLLGTSNGLVEIDLNLLKKPKDFNIYINQSNSFITDKPKKILNLSEKAKLEFEANNIEFTYSVSNFDKITTTKYQYLLTNYNKNWSKPSKSSSVLFENLPYGDYTFKVRGIIADKLSNNEAVYSFKIIKPWYLSNVLIVVYVLLFLFLFYFSHLASKRYYKKQRREFLEKAKKELEIRDLESSKEMIKIKNEKLKIDIESKNRELASSTLSIIKKNEFLSTIKKELLEGKGKTVDNVVKIIDKNMTNTDDWKMFKEAFNNADKKFLKKVKSKHPDLTPNDLKLCAYLRLNLSSKEIAPLLNISPRSVEVKRYRLRKKINLDHNENLTNYILEI